MVFSKKNNAKKKEKKEDRDKTEERLEKGQLHVRVILEMLGKPKEYISKLLRDYVKAIEKDNNFDVTSKSFAKPKRVEGEMHTLFAEVEMWVKSVNALIGFCFDYMPSSIEIIEPQRISYSAHDFAGMLNDLQAKLHDVDMKFKTTLKEKEIVEKNFANTIRNIVMLAISIGRRTEGEISQITGIQPENLRNILPAMVKEKKIAKKGNRYELAK